MSSDLSSVSEFVSVEVSVIVPLSSVTTDTSPLIPSLDLVRVIEVAITERLSSSRSSSHSLGEVTSLFFAAVYLLSIYLIQAGINFGS